MKDKQIIKKTIAQRRARRTRAKVAVSGRPRLSVFRSLKHLYAQIIDKDGQVLVAARSQEIKDKVLKGVALAGAVGELIAVKAKAKKIEIVVFDKGKFKYHGQVKAVADGARKEGLQF
ncbi:MAG: 50S ribosomal protein L18 [Candidatus Komeilibacteria bacterium]